MSEIDNSPIDISKREGGYLTIIIYEALGGTKYHKIFDGIKERMIKGIGELTVKDEIKMKLIDRVKTGKAISDPITRFVIGFASDFAVRELIADYE